ncbi:hypothetical protein AA16663_0635 [Komagataeibacter rhaeticus DSM 16663]|nr:hypothetical protein AA16663_0635 [Komagataeibacter rhaeticus DSM 16663]
MGAGLARGRWAGQQQRDKDEQCPGQALQHEGEHEDKPYPAMDFTEHAASFLQTGDGCA